MLFEFAVPCRRSILSASSAALDSPLRELAQLVSEVTFQTLGKFYISSPRLCSSIPRPIFPLVNLCNLHRDTRDIILAGIESESPILHSSYKAYSSYFMQKVARLALVLFLSAVFQHRKILSRTDIWPRVPRRSRIINLQTRKKAE